MNELIEKLKTMNEDQLYELFHDIDDIFTIERIYVCAGHFIEGHYLGTD